MKGDRQLELNGRVGFQGRKGRGFEMRALASFRSLDLRLSYIPPVSSTFFCWSIDVGGTLAFFLLFRTHARISLFGGFGGD